MAIDLSSLMNRFRLSYVLRNPADPYGPAVFMKVAPPVAEEIIVQFENQIGVKLPASYRDFTSMFGDVLIHGGKSNDVSVGVFYGLRGESVEAYRLDRAYKVTRGRVPNDWIPFATDGGGNWFCLSLKSPKAGAVFWCDHEDPNYTELLAPSFDDFIAGLNVS